MKKVLLVFLTMLICVALFAQGGTDGAGQEVLTLKLAEQMPDGHIMAETLKYFAERIEEHSGGTIKCEVYTGGVLGDDTATYEGVISGAIDIARLELTTAVNFGAKKAEVAALPYVIRDRDHFWKMVEAPVGSEILNSLQEDGTGMVGLCLIEEGARHFFMTEPINGIEDLSGKKIRVQNTEFWVEIIKCLGASPTPMSFSELYQALQTGVVDGAEQPLSGYVSQKFNEVCPYIILDGHVYPIQAYVFSEKNWNNLTPEQQEAIKLAAKDTQKYNRETIQDAEDNIMAGFDSMGVTVTEVSDKTPWINAVQPVYEKFGTPDVLRILGEIQSIE